jgi:flagellin-like protein
MSFKRGVSEIVTTVLIIMISVVAVGILWTTISPMIREALKSDFSNLDLHIGEDYTFYSPAAETMYVQVKRGVGSLSDFNLSSIKIYIGWNGEDRVGTRTNVPGVGGSIVYAFNGLPNKPTSVKIAPVVTVNGKQKIGKVTDEMSTIVESDDISGILDLESGFGSFDAVPPEPAPLPGGSLNE